MTEKKQQNENTQNNEVLTPFTNDLMFALVMRDPDICRGIAELLLPDEEIGEVIIATPDNPLFDENSDFEVMVQASLDFGKDMRGVRFDAYIKSKDIWIDIEMQTTNEKNLERRSRYYQTMMDSDCLEKGGKFNDKKNTYVVFICTFDYFGLDEPKYVVESYIPKNNLHFDDGKSKMILNTKCSPDKVPEKLRAFYKYINDPTKIDSKLVEDIDKRVRKYNTPEWRERQLTFGHMLDEAEKKGLEQGRTEGLAEGEASGRAAEKLAIAKALKDKGIDIDIISETSGLSKDEIEKL